MLASPYGPTQFRPYPSSQSRGEGCASEARTGLFSWNLACGLQEFGHSLCVVSALRSRMITRKILLSGSVSTCAGSTRGAAHLRRPPALGLWQATRSIAPLHMVLACLGAESFEVLRLVPPGVRRVGMIQLARSAALPDRCGAMRIGWMRWSESRSEVRAELRVRGPSLRPRRSTLFLTAFTSPL